MNSIETLATFFGWCTVLNFGILVVVFVFCSLFHEGLGALVGKVFGVSKDEAKATFLRTFMQFRLAFVVLNVVPYIALKIMGG